MRLFQVTACRVLYDGFVRPRIPRALIHNVYLSAISTDAMAVFAITLVFKRLPPDCSLQEYTEEVLDQQRGLNVERSRRRYPA